MKESLLSPARLAEIVAEFPSCSVMVVGDVMLDEYLWGDATRISPEAPVPVVAVESSTLKPGGGANVAWNLAALGVQPHLVSICGNDNNGNRLLNLLGELGIDSTGLYRSTDRPTTHKIRIVARHQQVVRADRESSDLPGTKESAAIWAAIESKLDTVRAIILSDYGKGVLDKALITRIITEAAKRQLFVAVDPKNRPFGDYRHAGVITPNLKEALLAAGKVSASCSDEELAKTGWELVEQADLTSLLVTLGERGMALFQTADKSFFHLHTVAQKVFDVTGAGDTVISIYTAAIACGATPKEAAIVANQAAGITVGEPGTAAVSARKLCDSFSD